MLNPWFPKYSALRGLIKALDGVREDDFHEMMKDIWNLVGNPRATVNWQNPDEWIPQRLIGASRDLALRIWHVSQGDTSPRYAQGAYWVAKRYELLAVSSGVLTLSVKGKCFLDSKANDVTREIDTTNGIAFILDLVDDLGSAKPLMLMPRLKDYCLRTEPKNKSERTIMGHLYRRLINLEERGYIATKAGNRSLTEEGKKYLESLNVEGPEPERKLYKIIRDNDKDVRKELLDYLAAIDPYAFEELVKTLFEAMGYEDVKTVGGAGDKGVDVIGTAQFGITEVKEVIQVKRKCKNISHSVVAQLRGSLFTHKALRGTVVTLGGFTKGAIDASAPPNVAPITLIDGEILLDLLIDNGIGVQKHELAYLSLDTESLKPVEEEEGEQPDKMQ